MTIWECLPKRFLVFFGKGTGAEDWGFEVTVGTLTVGKSRRKAQDKIRHFLPSLTKHRVIISKRM